VKTADLCRKHGISEASFYRLALVSSTPQRRKISSMDRPTASVLLGGDQKCQSGSNMQILGKSTPHGERPGASGQEANLG
jgi:hypothetical protein